MSTEEMKVLYTVMLCVQALIIWPLIGLLIGWVFGKKMAGLGVGFVIGFITGMTIYFTKVRKM